MTSIDDLHELLDATSTAATEVEPDLAGTLDRARRIRKQRRNVRVALLATLVVAGSLIAVTVGRHDQRVTLGTSPEPGVIPQAVKFSRTLADGTEIHGTYGGDTAIFGPFNDQNWWTPPASCPVPFTVVRPSVLGQQSLGGWGPPLAQPSLQLIEVGSGGWGFYEPIGYFREHTFLVLDARIGDHLRLVETNAPGGPTNVLDEATVDSRVTPLITPRQIVAANVSDPPSLLGTPPPDHFVIQTMDGSGEATASDLFIESPMVAAPSPKSSTPNSCAQPAHPAALVDLAPPADEAAAKQAVTDESMRVLVDALKDPAGLTPQFHTVNTGMAVNAKVTEVHWQSNDRVWVKANASIHFIEKPMVPTNYDVLYTPWIEVVRSGASWRVTAESRCALRRTPDATPPRPDNCIGRRLSNEQGKNTDPTR